MTSSVPPARPLWLEVEPDAVFGTFHGASDGVVGATAVLILPPWGWDEITSYRARRAWAERLAADGHPTLRIDLPGTGDSGGTPADPGRVEAWVGSITTSAAWLAAQPGVARVAAIGLGLGGLLVGPAIAAGAPIDELVLWAAPARGRAFLREQRAFAALQSSRFSASGEAEPSLLPAGWVEVGGFVLSVETIDAIAGIELAAMPPDRVRRALLMERDGMGRDRELEAALTALGVEVTAAAGDGWTDMVFHPERYAPPLGVFERVEDWLADGSAAVTVEPATTAGSVATSEALTLDVGGTRIRETPVRISEPFGQLFGILGEPTNTPPTSLCAIFLNAGAVRRVGPNRLWVEAARQWNARGIPTIRMDLEGIGDADGDPRRYLDVANFYTTEFGAQVGSILADLERRGFGPRFVLIGLCAGGYWAFTTAAADPRIVEAIILNPRAMVWDPGLLTRREARKAERLLEPGLWNQVIRGQIPVSRMLAISRAVASRTAAAALDTPRRVRAGRSKDSAPDSTAVRLDALRDLKTRTVVAFSGEEPVHHELESDGILRQLDRWPNLVMEPLPGRDHTVRSIVAQRAVHALLDRELALLLADDDG